MSKSSDIWQLLDKHRPGADEPSDRIIYLGDAQDAIPRMLIYDRDLSATDVRIWMCLRTHVDLNHESNRCPSYDEIMDKIGIGSRETVANALLTLRGTRWLSIIGPRRDHNNRVIRNLYALHSEPLPPQDVLALDEGYMATLDKLQQHPSSRLRELGSRLDQSMTEALVNEGDSTPLSTIKDRLETSKTVHHPAANSSPSTFFGRPSSHQEEQVKLVIDNDHAHEIENTHPSTKIELGSDNQQNNDNKSHGVVNTPPKYENRTAISSSSRFINTTTTESENNSESGRSATTPSDNPKSEGTDPEHDTGRSATTLSLHYFDNYVRFTPNEKNLLARLVMRLPVDVRQQFIDELAGQILEKRDTPAQIRNPISFAHYLVNQQVSGFDIWSSAYERMAKKRHEQTRTDEERKALEAEQAARREAANAAHREKLKKWEAELAAQKDKQTKVRKP